MRTVPIAPWERFALLGKTGSAKTTTGVCLACTLIPYDKKEANGWEAWWLDSKGDPKDHKRLYEWGFRVGHGPRRLFMLREQGPKKPSIHEQCEAICKQALRRHGVLVIVDEYVHVVLNQQNPGRYLLDIFQRGRGLDVGLLGFTQEPVFIPRQLISQASHILLHDLSYPRDQERARDYYPEYDRPPDRIITADGQERRVGFYHGAIDYDGNWVYWPNVQTWLDAFRLERVA